MNDDTTPYQELVCAIVQQTIYDYRKKDERHAPAALLLRSRRLRLDQRCFQQAREFCEAWGLDLEYISERLETVTCVRGY
jgi:hypothetical protein